MSVTLCCCLSLQKGVVTIGVVCMLYAGALVVLNVVSTVTLEEHVFSCRRGEPSNDALGVFPVCKVLTDASLVIAVRTFVYIQLLVWASELIVSALLIVGAAKKRSVLLLPWQIVTVASLIVMLWGFFRGPPDGRGAPYHLPLLVGAFIIAFYFLIVVTAFCRQISRTPRHQTLTLSNSQHYHHRYPHLNPQHPLFVCPAPSGSFCLNPCKEEDPPHYDQVTPPTKTTSSSGKMVIPTGLGVRR